MAAAAECIVCFHGEGKQFLWACPTCSHEELCAECFERLRRDDGERVIIDIDIREGNVGGRGGGGGDMVCPKCRAVWPSGDIAREKSRVLRQTPRGAGSETVEAWRREAGREKERERARRRLRARRREAPTERGGRRARRRRTLLLAVLLLPALLLTYLLGAALDLLVQGGVSMRRVNGIGGGVVDVLASGTPAMLLPAEFDRKGWKQVFAAVNRQEPPPVRAEDYGGASATAVASAGRDNITLVWLGGEAEVSVVRVEVGAPREMYPLSLVEIFVRLAIGAIVLVPLVLIIKQIPEDRVD